MRSNILVGLGLGVILYFLISSFFYSLLFVGGFITGIYILRDNSKRKKIEDFFKKVKSFF